MKSIMEYFKGFFIDSKDLPNKKKGNCKDADIINIVRMSTRARASEGMVLRNTSIIDEEGQQKKPYDLNRLSVDNKRKP